MPRKSRLALVNERPITDEEAALMAGAALDEAEALEHPLAPPADILAALRGQLAETTQVATAAIEQANQERARADAATAEIGQAKAETAKVRAEAGEHITSLNRISAQTAADIQRQANVADRQAAAAGMVRQAIAALGGLLSFLVDRAPVLLTLIGAYLLARDILAEPSVTQLSLLGIYGCVAVAPAVWLSVRRA